MSAETSKNQETESQTPVGNVAEMRTGRMNTVGVPAEKSKNFALTAKRLARRMGRETWLVFLILLMAVSSVALIVSGPRILGHATDIIFDGLVQRDGITGIDFGRLHRTLELAIGVYMLSYVLAYGQSFLLAGVVQRTMFKMRRDVEAKIHRLPLSYIDKNSRGDLLSRATNDIDNIAQSLQQSLSQLVVSLLTIVGVIFMMFTVSVVLAVIALTVIPLSLWTMSIIAKRSRAKFISQWNYTGQLNGLVEEAFTGHAIVKVFGRQQEVEERFKNLNDELFKAANSAQFISGAIQPATMFLGNLNYVAIAVVGGIRVATGTMSLGDVQAFVQYSRQFTQPLTQAASMANVLQSGVASAERVFELLDAEEQSADVGSIDPSPTIGRVEFDKVTFSYDPNRPLITDLSFVAEPGTTVAIVGPTGAGKTTLVNLIMRFYELNGGRIVLDNRNIAEMPRQELRSKIGMVLQDTWLFNGTIRENIAYGNPGASDEQIRTAAKATFVDRFVQTLPEGYDTILTGESGAVSAGEKQLLTIARAFLADPAILILD
jgi:ATP-binding cassette subfamily B protein